jgi:transposase InsO family protein
LDLIWAFDFICETYEIDHRTTRPYTPQTNGMVEKVNDTIKLNTLKIHTYNNIWEMKADLSLFLIYYNLARRHSSLRTEIWVKTPFEAIEYWFKLSPNLFKETPFEFKEKLLTIKKNL